MKRWGPAYLAAALLVLLFHFRLALPGRALVANDFRALFIPLRAGLQNTVRAGEWPIWQRGIFMGYPILGDIQFQIFNPLTWLTLLLGPARGVTVQSLLELCICAVGMAYWMKQRGLRPLEGVFAGVAFALCLKQTVHLHHWTFASSTCMWPFMLAGLEGFAKSGRPRFLALTALATCGTWIGSSPQMAYFGTGLAFLYALWLRQIGGAAAVALGVALAAPLLLPVAELSALGPRGAGVTYKFAASWSWPNRSVWASMLLPRAWGGRPDFRGPMNYWELQGYFGLLPMALLLAVPVRKKGVWLFAAVAALGIWLSFGDSSWLGLHGWAVKLIPGYGSFRNPTRVLMLSMFCIAVLAAEGLAALREDYRLRLRVMAALGALLVFVALLAIFPQGFPDKALRADAAWACALLALSTAWAFFARADARWAALAVPLLIADLAVQTWDSPEIGESAGEGHALEALAPHVPKAPAPRRVAALLDWGEMNNATFTRGWEGVTGYGPTPIERVLLLLSGTWTGMVPRPQPLDDDPNFPRFRVDSDLTRLFAAPLLAANRDASVPPLARSGNVRLYAMPSLARVYWTGAWRAAPDTEISPLLHQAARGSFAVLPEKADFPSGAEENPVPAEDVQVHNSWTTATLRAPRDGLAVVLDPWFPGWSATVDGNPAPLLRANYAFMAVPVRAGRHVLRLSYFPRRLWPGLAIALLAAAALVVLLKVAARRVDTGSPGGY
ncbi:MAG TPA: YfhO family protein [Myxococcales bacterium]